MSVELIFYRKNIEPDDEIIEMKIWKIPHTKDKTHGLKYSLVYIKEDKRLIGYDNAEGKGDHKHCRGREYPYKFKDIDALITDFYLDIERARRGEL